MPSLTFTARPGQSAGDGAAAAQAAPAQAAPAQAAPAQAAPAQAAATQAAAAQAAAELMLSSYPAAAAGPGHDRAADPGPAILAALVSAGRAPAELAGETAAERAVIAWLRQLSRPAPTGLLGNGAAGRMLALRLAAGVWPRLAGLAEAVRQSLCRRVARVPWAVTELAWGDYDLVTGPSGTLLALAAEPGASAADRAPVIGHLAGLCATDDLAGLRVGQYRDEDLRGWNFGRINLGLAHGLPGVALALAAAADADGLSEPGEQALRRLAARLAREAFTDPRGVLTWPPGSGRAGPGAAAARRRQAWCYGCPGVAWALWESGRVLGDDGLRDLAESSAGSLIGAWDDEFYLDGLDICHGAAGLMLVYDSFSRHAGLPGAAGLRDHLAGHLTARLGQLSQLAETNCSLQSGASGVLAALLTTGGADRRWLAATGLR